MVFVNRLMLVFAFALSLGFSDAHAGVKSASFRSFDRLKSQDCFKLERMFRFANVTGYQGARPDVDARCFNQLEVTVTFDEASLVNGRFTIETFGFPSDLGSDPRTCWAIEDLVNRSMSTGAFFWAQCFAGKLTVEVMPN